MVSSHDVYFVPNTRLDFPLSYKTAFWQSWAWVPGCPTGTFFKSGNRLWSTWTVSEREYHIGLWWTHIAPVLGCERTGRSDESVTSGFRYQESL